MNVRIPESVVLESITPEVAKGYLASNDRNYRSLNQEAVRRYARDMVAGRWAQRHPQGIAFDWEGKLGDGQHRLAAIVESGRTIQAWVHRGVNPEAFLDADRGRVRTDGDVLRATGFRKDVDPRRAASVARNMLTGIKGGRPVGCVRTFARAHEDLIGTFLLGLAKARPRRSEVVAAFCNAARELAERDVLESARRYSALEFMGPEDPLRLLQVRLVEGISKRRFLGSGMIYALAVTAIRASVEGRSLQALRPATRDFEAGGAGEEVGAPPAVEAPARVPAQPIHLEVRPRFGSSAGEDLVPLPAQ